MMSGIVLEVKEQDEKHYYALTDAQVKATLVIDLGA
jgi:hypothetical protein